MKKALLAVALMMAAMTGWCDTTDWTQMYGLPTSQDWNFLEVWEIRTRLSDISEFDALAIDLAEKSGFTSYYSLFDISKSPVLYDHMGSEICRIKRTGDDSSVVNGAITRYKFSEASVILACSDTNLKEYLLVQRDENGNYEPNTWKSFQAVPEPASGLLIVMGSVLLAFRRKVA